MIMINLKTCLSVNGIVQYSTTLHDRPKLEEVETLYMT